MDGLQFEHRCAELLRYRGFHKVAVTKGSGDQGVDILAQKNGIKNRTVIRLINNFL